jgi:prepilin-type processing-associated H-X9-DG protein
LIELLVVVAIISLLVSILLPSLNRAKDAAKAAVCLSNLKNVGLAVVFYSENNEGWSPSAYKKTENSFWCSKLVPYSDAPQEGGRTIFRCPSHPPQEWDPGANPQMFVYGMRTSGVDFQEHYRITGTPVTSNRGRLFGPPGGCWLLADSIHSGYDSQQFYWVQELPPSIWAASNKIHRRHAGRANTVFADAHAEALDFEGFDSLPLSENLPTWWANRQSMYLLDYPW